MGQQVFTVRVKDTKLFEAIHKEAAQHGQSVNQFILELLRQRLTVAPEAPAPNVNQGKGMAFRRAKNARVLYEGPARHCDRCGNEITQRDKESLAAFLERHHCGRACSEMAPDYIPPDEIEAAKRRIRMERNDWVPPELRDVE